MPDSGQTIGIIAFLLLLMFSLSIMSYNPLLGLVVLFTSVIILAISTDPSSAKVMMKLFMPIIIILLVLAISMDYIGEITREISIVAVILLFATTLILGAAIGGMDVGSGIALAPMIIIPTLLALLADPSGNLAVIVASSLLFGWMFFVYLLTKNPPPEYPIGFGKKVGVAITPLNPKGKVKIGAEIWNGVSKQVPIREGEEVYILEKVGLELMVTLAVRCPHCNEPYPITNIPLNCLNCSKPLLDLKAKSLDLLNSRMK